MCDGFRLVNGYHEDCLCRLKFSLVSQQGAGENNVGRSRYPDVHSSQIIPRTRLAERRRGNTAVLKAITCNTFRTSVASGVAQDQLHKGLKFTVSSKNMESIIWHRDIAHYTLTSRSNSGVTVTKHRWKPTKRDSFGSRSSRINRINVNRRNVWL